MGQGEMSRVASSIFTIAQLRQISLDTNRMILVHGCCSNNGELSLVLPVKRASI